MVLVTVLPSLPTESCTHGAREITDDWAMETQSANPNQSRYEVYERKIWKDKEGDREKRIIKWKRIKMEREKIEIIGMGGGGGGEIFRKGGWRRKMVGQRER